MWDWAQAELNQYFKHERLGICPVATNGTPSQRRVMAVLYWPRYAGRTGTHGYPPYYVRWNETSSTLRFDIAFYNDSGTLVTDTVYFPQTNNISNLHGLLNP